MSGRYTISITSLIVVVTYVALSLGWTTTGIANDPGLGWHLKTGELIASSRVVPAADPFLALPSGEYEGITPAAPRAWIADQWLSDLVLFFAVSTGGWSLVYALCLGLFTITFWGIVAPTTRQLGSGAIVTLVATMFAWRVSQVHFIVRPVLVSFLLFACVYARLRVLARKPALTAKDVVYEGIVLMPVFALWANLHPAFILGLLLVAVLSFVELTRSLEGRASRGVLIAALFLTCLAATMLNPNGSALHRAILDLGANQYFMSLNQEWQPVTLAHVMSVDGITFLLLTVGSVLLVLTSRSCCGANNRFELIATVVLAYEAFQKIRLIPFAAIVAVPICALALGALARLRVPSVCGLTWRFFRTLEQFESTKPTSRMLACILSLGGIAWVGLGGDFAAEVAPSTSHYPPAMIESISRDRSSGIVYGSPDWGGFLTWKLYPNFKAVLDDRNTLVGERLYRLYFQSLKDRAVLDDIVQAFSVTHVIMPKTAPVVSELSQGMIWPILYADESHIVFKVSGSLNGQ